MKIELKRLELSNFKCFRHKEFDFANNVTVLRGRNGVGKTTVADAILWCLFGKNTQGQSDFDLKTHDSDGKPIPHLDHSVEMTLAVDDNPVTLRRTLKETWLKKRGSDEQVFKNNTTEYLVNGEVVTATDYKKYISELINEDIFRVITNPSYFPSLKWQQQREFLTAMVGDVTPEADTEFADLLYQLSQSNEDIIAYRKHLSYQIKKIKDKLDRIPVRLEEQNKALPERLDWDTLSSQQSAILSQKSEVESQILQIRSGNGDDLRKDEIRRKLDSLHAEKRTIEVAIQKQVFDMQSEINARISELTAKFRELLNTQRDLETTIPSFDRLTERCQETLAQCERDAEDIRKRWVENNARKVEFDDSDAVCPTCGQPLPESQVYESRQKAVENLNRQKADVKQALKEQADKVKATRADAERQIEDIKSRKAEAEHNLSVVKEDINKAFSEKQKAEKEKESLPVYEMLCNESMERKSVMFKIALLEEDLQSASATSDDDARQLSELEAKKAEYSDILQQLSSQLSSRSQYERIQSLISDIENEQAELITQLSELERTEDVARRFQDRQNAILESRVNEHFSLVKWRMFRTVNNGGDPFDEPYCECYVNGVAYHDGLNQAARLNAGLDICNVLCKHYNVSAPIIIDNSESSLNILETVGQQLRLEVFDSDLQIV